MGQWRFSQFVDNPMFAQVAYKQKYPTRTTEDLMENAKLPAAIKAALGQKKKSITDDSSINPGIMRRMRRDADDEARAANENKTQYKPEKSKRRIDSERFDVPGVHGLSQNERDRFMSQVYPDVFELNNGQLRLKNESQFHNGLELEPDAISDKVKVKISQRKMLEGPTEGPFSYQ